jgi:dTDP-4-dehydrorhamnose reductase
VNRLRVALVGAGGQVGQALLQSLQPVGEILPLRRADLDLANADAVEETVRAIRPDLVINAAAYTQVDAAERDSDTAWAVNAEAPAAMARAAAQVGAGMIHFSTDYVFDGRKSAPYDETDAPAPLNVYGRSKLAGDAGVEAVGAPYLIFRTSWVYDCGGRNFFSAIVKRARDTGRLRVVADQVGAPTHAVAIADAVATILRQLAGDSRALSATIADRSGLYNMSAGGSTSWFGFAEAIIADLGLEALVEPIATRDYGAAAARPAYSVLDNSRLRETFGIGLRDWREELAVRCPPYAA